MKKREDENGHTSSHSDIVGDPPDTTTPAAPASSPPLQAKSSHPLVSSYDSHTRRLVDSPLLFLLCRSSKASVSVCVSSPLLYLLAVEVVCTCVCVCVRVCACVVQVCVTHTPEKRVALRFLTLCGAGSGLFSLTLFTLSLSGLWCAVSGRQCSLSCSSSFVRIVFERDDLMARTVKPERWQLEWSFSTVPTPSITTAPAP
jgi:hypothetical protein